MKVNYLEKRHIGLSEADEKKMLEAIGAESVDALVRETMPADILLPLQSRCIWRPQRPC